jgi:NAD(P)-dependent dehydrogenase (short-subunit alcohol dehydrogenase family)
LAAARQQRWLWNEFSEGQYQTGGLGGTARPTRSFFLSACLVIGAGDGVGAAVARAFAREGLTVCVTRRPRNIAQLEELADEIRGAGGKAQAYGVDARDEAEMVALFDRIESEHGTLDVVVFNIGANVWFPVTETTSRVYTKVWEMAAFSGFLAGREAARVMTPRGRGTVIFTGATASLRGRATFSAFAGAKHALRALAQSMARELGPVGIHVAHVVVDGMIDGTFARSNFADTAERVARDEIVDPAEIAKAYVYLHNQGRSAWTHEMDLRPWREAW